MGDKNKSGYELRSDLLGMAIGIVDQKTQRLFENEHLKPEGQRNAVAPFTTEEVIADTPEKAELAINSRLGTTISVQRVLTSVPSTVFTNVLK